MIISLKGKIRSINFVEQEIKIECSIDKSTSVYYYSESLFSNKDWIYPSILNGDIIDAQVDGKILVDILPYDHEF